MYALLLILSRTTTMTVTVTVTVTVTMTIPFQGRDQRTEARTQSLNKIRRLCNQWSLMNGRQLQDATIKVREVGCVLEDCNHDGLVVHLSIVN